MRLVMLGQPGAGKGTQATLLCGRYGIVHISTGEMIRSAIASGDPVVKQVKEAHDRGELIPDKIIIEMTLRRLGEIQAEPGFLLDGFPRNRQQARELDVSLAELSTPLDAVILLDVDEAEVRRRLASRGRGDDTPDIVGQRLAVYRRETDEVASYYEDQSLLRRVCGVGTVEVVGRNIVQALETTGADRCESN